MAHKISGSKCTVLRKPLTEVPGLLLNDTNLIKRQGREAEVNMSRGPVTGTKTMVVSPHYLASAAGAQVLAKGGNAYDAAVAVSAALAVVYPHMTGLGGDAFWLGYSASEGCVRAYNGSGRSATPSAGTAMPGRRPFPGGVCAAPLRYPEWRIAGQPSSGSMDG